MKGVREATRAFQKRGKGSYSRIPKNGYTKYHTVRENDYVIFLSFLKNFSTDTSTVFCGQVGLVRFGIFRLKLGKMRTFFALGIGPNLSNFNLTKLVHTP